MRAFDQLAPEIRWLLASHPFVVHAVDVLPASRSRMRGDIARSIRLTVEKHVAAEAHRWGPRGMHKGRFGDTSPHVAADATPMWTQRIEF